MTSPMFESPFPETVHTPELEDRWTTRARPMFLYVIYAMIIWALPVGLLAALSPSRAKAVAEATAAYLGALPEPLYALFGTGYLGYTAMRQWGKVKGVER